MKLKQQSRLTQQLAITPRVQQSIRLLQLSATDLNQELEKALQDNPLLERVDNPLENTPYLPVDKVSLSSPIEKLPLNRTEISSDRQQHETAFRNPSYPVPSSDEDFPFPQTETPSLSLQEHLTSQIHLVRNNKRQLALAELIIDALDENGYLIETLEEMLAWLPDELEITLSELESALVQVQSLEPAGIAARNSAECLAIQLKRLPNLPYVTRKRALAIVENHLLLFARHDFVRLKKRLDCDDEDLAEAQKAIQSCNPHPGAAFSSEKIHTLVPELITFHKDGRWHAKLNPSVIPHIRINTLHTNIVKNAEDQRSIAAQLQEANWFIRNLRQRFDTILRTGQAIVERQQNFFSDGVISMKPLVLREIADTLTLHESTISRVTNQKYMHTPHGTFELKYFFGSHLISKSGSTVSSTAIREQIRQLIGAEDRKKPLSDNKIAQALGKQGLVIARRTVAKYRETLKIPPAHMRKFL
ncbi:MAG: RNA polymerase factor sigma-54 [Betaproteobacteria bacterium]|nr:RNA polymerase factor sigma-54 [Betaproteobacteria bacterium]